MDFMAQDKRSFNNCLFQMVTQFDFAIGVKST
jgi:hypothetical protein